MKKNYGTCETPASNVVYTLQMKISKPGEGTVHTDSWSPTDSQNGKS